VRKNKQVSIIGFILLKFLWTTAFSNARGEGIYLFCGHSWKLFGTPWLTDISGEHKAYTHGIRIKLPILS
jgi:hypothetical protein